MESEHVLPTYVNIEKLSYHQYEKKPKYLYQFAVVITSAYRCKYF